MALKSTKFLEDHKNFATNVQAWDFKDLVWVYDTEMSAEMKAAHQDIKDAVQELPARLAPFDGLKNVNQSFASGKAAAVLQEGSKFVAEATQSVNEGAKLLAMIMATNAVLTHQAGKAEVKLVNDTHKYIKNKLKISDLDLPAVLVRKLTQAQPKAATDKADASADAGDASRAH